MAIRILAIFVLLVFSAEAQVTDPYIMGPQLGAHLAALHDVNGDGVADYVATAPASQQGSPTFPSGGQILVYSGSDNSLIWSTAISADGNNLGMALCLADWNGNGTNEIISVRRWLNSVSLSPRIDVFNAANGSLIVSRLLPPSVPWYSVGERLASTDLNGDGLEEVLVALPGSAVPTASSFLFPSGSVLIMDPVNYLPTIISDSSVGDFGRGVYIMGDLDFDGARDIVITAPGAAVTNPTGSFANAGIIRILSGATLTTMHQFSGTEANERLGDCLCPIEDFNVDGIPDLSYIGKSTVGGVDTYRIHVFLGLINVHLVQDLPSDFVPGTVMKIVGDVDNDGVDDLGISGTFPAHACEGIQLISLSDLRPLDRILGPGLSTDYARDFAAIADGDGDGRWDLAVGEPYANAGQGQIDRRTVLPVLSALGDGSPSHDLLRVNGSSALPSRRVDLAVGEPFSIGVDPDPTTGQPTDHIIWGLIGIPNQASVFNVTGGSFLFPPRIAAPSLPWLFTLTDSVGYDPAAAFPGYQAPWSIGAPFGIAFPVDLTLQGVTISAGNIDISNGIILSVR